jgi:glutamate-1-semialdehyde 2,1-aminomutase
MSERVFDLSRSFEMYQRAREVIPGGVGSNDRSLVDPHPIFITHGQGSRIWDVDGNEYVDYLLGYGPLVLGHANPLLVEAVARQMAKGSVFGIGHPLEPEVAELLVDLIPSFEQVRFAQSGTEAVLIAIRLARAATGRSRIVKFEGHYHGWADQVAISYSPGETDAGDCRAPTVVPMSAGQVPGAYQDVAVAPWNDLEALEWIFAESDEPIAAVLTEPLMCNFGVIEPVPGYLEGIRRLCDRHGAALIFDEVQCGMRLGVQGAQGMFGVQPDLTCLGKALAGGLPISAVGGRHEIMEMIGDRRVFQAGTFNTNPLCLAAIPTVVGRLSEPGTFAEMERLTALLRAGLSEEVAKIGGLVQGTTTMFGVRFGDSAIASMRDGWDHDWDRIMLFKEALRLRGVYTKPTPRDIWYVSTEHTDDDIRWTLEVAADAVAALQTESAGPLARN